NAYFHDFGGGERFPIELASVLQEGGYTPIVVTRSPKLLQLAQDRDIRVIRGWWWKFQGFSGKIAPLFPIYLAWQFLLTLWYASLILRFKPQILHPQSRDDFIAATVAGRILGKHVIWTDHADLKYIWQNHSVWYKNPVGKL